MFTISWLKYLASGIARTPRTRNSLRRQHSRSRGTCRPRVERLEDRCVPASGIFVEDFSDDFDSSLPGFDSSVDGFRIKVDAPGGSEIVEGGFGFLGETFSPPHTLQTSGLAVVTFPDLAAGDVVHVASIKVWGLSISARVFSTTGESLDIFEVFEFQAVHHLLVSSASRSDSGNPLGPIARIDIGGALDDIRVQVGGEPPVTGGVIFTENFSDDLEPDRPGFDAGLDGFDLRSTYEGGVRFIDLPALDIPQPDANQASSPWGLLLEPGDGHDGNLTDGSYTARIPDVSARDALLPGEEIALAKVSVYGDGRVTFVGTTGRTSTVDVFAFQGWQFVSRASGFEDAQGQRLGGIVEIRVETSSFMVIDDVTVLIGTEQGTGAVRAFDDGAVGLPGAPIEIPVLVNDFSVNGDPLTITSITDPSRGTAIISAADKITYTSAPSFRGTDTFEYTVTDGNGNSDTARVVIEVPNQAPVAVDVREEIDHGTAGPRVSAFAFADVNGDAVTAVLVRPPDFGEVTFQRSPSDPSGTILVEYRYQPYGGVFIGSDRFTYRLNDGMDDSNFATITLFVPNFAPTVEIPVEDATIILTHAEALDQQPITGNVLRWASDLDGDRLTAQLVGLPAHGRVALNPDGSFVLNPALGAGTPGFVTDTFSFRVHDGHSFSLPATLTVVAPNSEPVAAGEFFVKHNSPFETSTLSLAVSQLLANDVDFDEDLATETVEEPLTVTVVQQPTKGTLRFSEATQEFLYEPFLGAWGFDVFAYEVADSWTRSNVATVTISMNAGSPITGEVFFAPQILESRIDGYPTEISDFFSFDVSPGLVSRVPAPTLLEYAVDPGAIYYNADQPSFFQLTERKPLILSPHRVELLGIEAGGEVIPPGRTFHGFVTVDDLGGFTYEPDDGYLGEDRLSYRVIYDHRVGDDRLPFVPADRRPIDPLLPLVSNPRSVFLYVGEDATTFGPDAEPLDSTDGLSASVEDAAPNGGDGNGDGIPDKHQPMVASLPNAVNGNYVTLAARPGAELHLVEALLPPEGDEAVYPIGRFSFRLTKLAVGEATQVTIFLESPVRVDSYLKNHGGRINFNYDGSTGAQFFDADGRLLAPFSGNLVSRIVLHFVDGQRGDADGMANGIIVDPGGPAFVRPATVESVVINNGGRQRSKINSLTVTFNSRVIPDPGAFELRRLGIRKPVGLKIALSESDGRTVARLTFRGRGIIGGSLADGRYRLVIHGNKIHDSLGRALDGDNNGTAGGDHITKFFRLFGDTDGDRDVDHVDQRRFRRTYFRRQGKPHYAWHLDFDGDGRVRLTEALAFKIAYQGGARRR